MRLKNIILFNRAPFNNLKLQLEDENIIVLSGINGTGKTTIISYIVDALYELAKKSFSNEFEDKENKYYRISSRLYSLHSEETSIVYLRFADNDGNNMDYIDVREKLSQEKYDAVIDLPDKIPFSVIEKEQNIESVVKHWSLEDRNTINQLFQNNILTYFPAYRYEKPSYLNDPYSIELSFNKRMNYTGYLPNPIEVTSDLPQIANWIMDVVLDHELYKGSTESLLLNQVNDLITNILMFKIGYATRVGIGQRAAGASRICIMNRDKEQKQIYPSIFFMSSGELALLCLFGEIIKQADVIGSTSQLISGIVLVDEVDKHLHIRLQKEILPKLISMFPNVQFMVSSHSPFLGLGLNDSEALNYSIFDLDNKGISCPPQDNELFNEVYNIMINQNNQYYQRYKQLEEIIKRDSKPLVITEGKTDWKHLKKAMNSLDITNLDIDFYEYEDEMGDTKLKQLLVDYARIDQPRTILGIFDRDNVHNLHFDDLSSSHYTDLGNNVFAVIIPPAHVEEYGTETTIEHYYKREDLTKLSDEGRRVFLGDEFFESGISKDSKYHTRCKNIQKKVLSNGIIDDRVYDVIDDPEENHSLALSKNDFAELITNNNDFAKDIDFSSFTSIFSIINEIIDSKAQTFIETNS